MGILCIAALGVMGLWLPINSKFKFVPQVYVVTGLAISWLAIAFVNKGEYVIRAMAGGAGGYLLKNSP